MCAGHEASSLLKRRVRETFLERANFPPTSTIESEWSMWRYRFISCCHLRPENSLLWEGSGHCEMFHSITDSLPTTCQQPLLFPQLWQPEASPDVAKCPWGDRRGEEGEGVTPGENHLSRQRVNSSALRWDKVEISQNQKRDCQVWLWWERWR